MQEQTLDQTKTEKFAQRMLDVSNHGALAMMTSIGHRTGLFDAMARLPASTSAEAIGNARNEAAEKNLQNTEFVIRDLSDFDKTAELGAFDFITTFDAIHDQARPLNGLKGIHRALKTDGVYLMQDIRGTSHVYTDFGHLIGTFLYTASTMHCISREEKSRATWREICLNPENHKTTREVKWQIISNSCAYLPIPMTNHSGWVVRWRNTQPKE